MQKSLLDDGGNGKQETAKPEAPVNRISEHLDLPPDPFDPASLRLSQDFASSIGVKRVLTVVPCRKPNRHEFVRVREGDQWRLETGVFEDKVNRDTYLVARELWPELLGEVLPVCLFPVSYTHLTLPTNREV